MRAFVGGAWHQDPRLPGVLGLRTLLPTAQQPSSLQVKRHAIRQCCFRISVSRVGRRKILAHYALKNVHCCHPNVGHAGKQMHQHWVHCFWRCIKADKLVIQCKRRPLNVASMISKILHLPAGDLASLRIGVPGVAIYAWRA